MPVPSEIILPQHIQEQWRKRGIKKEKHYESQGEVAAKKALWRIVTLWRCQND
jgi:hypothetical protein